MSISFSNQPWAAWVTWNLRCFSVAPAIPLLLLCLGWSEWIRPVSLAMLFRIRVIWFPIYFWRQQIFLYPGGLTGSSWFCSTEISGQSPLDFKVPGCSHEKVCIWFTFVSHILARAKRPWEVLQVTSHTTCLLMALVIRTTKVPKLLSFNPVCVGLGVQRMKRSTGMNCFVSCLKISHKRGQEFPSSFLGPYVGT